MLKPYGEEFYFVQSLNDVIDVIHFLVLVLTFNLKTQFVGYKHRVIKKIDLYKDKTDIQSQYRSLFTYLQYFIICL